MMMTTMMNLVCTLRISCLEFSMGATLIILWVIGWMQHDFVWTVFVSNFFLEGMFLC